MGRVKTFSLVETGDEEADIVWKKGKMLKLRGDDGREFVRTVDKVQPLDDEAREILGR